MVTVSRWLKSGEAEGSLGQLWFLADVAAPSGALGLHPLLWFPRASFARLWPHLWPGSILGSSGRAQVAEGWGPSLPAFARAPRVAGWWLLTWETEGCCSPVARRRGRNTSLGYRMEGRKEEMEPFCCPLSSSSWPLLRGCIPAWLLKPSLEASWC